MNQQDRTPVNRPVNKALDKSDDTFMNRMGEGESPVKVKSKAVQVMESRKAWAGILGMAVTVSLWGMGEIDGARAVEAMTWVLGIFIGSVALEDGMARLFASLAGAVRVEGVRVEAVKAEKGKAEAHETASHSLQ